MSKAPHSGIKVSKKDLPLVFGMIERGDRNHDIAAWFGYNQGRVAEVKGGKHGSVLPASKNELPPSGSPGPRARDLRAALDHTIKLLAADDFEGSKKALTKAVKEFDKNE